MASPPSTSPPSLLQPPQSKGPRRRPSLVSASTGPELDGELLAGSAASSGESSLIGGESVSRPRSSSGKSEATSQGKVRKNSNSRRPSSEFTKETAHNRVAGMLLTHSTLYSRSSRCFIEQLIAVWHFPHSFLRIVQTTFYISNRPTSPPSKSFESYQTRSRSHAFFFFLFSNSDFSFRFARSYFTGSIVGNVPVDLRFSIKFKHFEKIPNRFQQTAEKC